MCEKKIGKRTWYKYLTTALSKYGSVNSADKHEQEIQPDQPSMSENKMPKNDAAKSFFSIAMLKMRNDQRTHAISETAVFIKFQ